MLADLDELILACRSATAKSYIAEAVGCYRSGAHRSAIITAWVAVLFDFLDKLRELEMAGDLNAKQKLAEFEKARQSSDWKAALEFERQVLTVAQNEFELVSPLEALDLQRLLDDRNRCAHPSMSSPNDPYQPAPELARSHIRNTVAHLLSHPPVQGKAALDRIINDLESEYFPTDPQKAVEFFKAGPLNRARDALVRNLVIVLSKKLLKESADSTPRARRFAALNAILEMHVEQGEKTLATILPDVVATVTDDRWYRVIFLLANVGSSWQFIGDAGRVKARSYIENAPDEDLYRIIPYGVRISHLREITMTRLPAATDKTLAKVIAVDPSSEYLDLAIARFEKASSFRNSETLLELVVIPLADFMDKSHIERICKAFAANSQIRNAIKVPNLLLDLFRKTSSIAIHTKQSWELVYETVLNEKDSITTADQLEKGLFAAYGFLGF